MTLTHCGDLRVRRDGPHGERGFADLLAAARAGDTWAHRSLYELVAGELLGFLRARGTPEPEEVVNDVFVAAFTGLSGFSGNEGGFRS